MNRFQKKQTIWSSNRETLRMIPRVLLLSSQAAVLNNPNPMLFSNRHQPNIFFPSGCNKWSRRGPSYHNDDRPHQCGWVNVRRRPNLPIHPTPPMLTGRARQEVDFGKVNFLNWNHGVLNRAYHFDKEILIRRSRSLFGNGRGWKPLCRYCIVFIS